LPFIPGGDFSGVVDAIGKDVEGIQPEDQVFGYSFEVGAYAEFITLGADKIALKPKSATHIEAASLALVAQTALQMLDRVDVHEARTVLVQELVTCRQWRAWSRQAKSSDSSATSTRLTIQVAFPLPSVGFSRVGKRTAEGGSISRNSNKSTTRRLTSKTVAKEPSYRALAFAVSQR
jgi:hypothetical protein